VDSPAPLLTAPVFSERRLVLIVAAVQFVNILDFVMVMPLGPDFATALDIPMSRIGIVGGSYTLAAALSGVIGSTFLDRFDRRKALGVAMFGLAAATALGALATGMVSLLLTRVLAGVFGGPATSLSIAAVSDVVPAARRGRALGTVMAAFSVASVLGVPAGLELARVISWRAPFVGVALLAAVVTTLALLALPPLRSHLTGTEQRGSEPPLELPPLIDKLALLSLANTFAVMFGVFLVVPNIASYFLFNLDYPRDQLGFLYLVGGAASFVTLRVVGVLCDRFGATRFVVLGTALHLLALWTGFIDRSLAIPALAVFVVFMLSGNVRMVPNASLATRVPPPARRASFMSTQSAVQHTASALGAIVGAAMLMAEPSGRLVHMDWVAGLAALMALMVPFIAWRLERGVLRREV
jgi:predicted MFS family arabinose efflux permease